MIVEPKLRSFLCLTAHPEGCRKNVDNQVQYTTKKGKPSYSPKNVLIIGSSMGYGLASRIVSVYGSSANTIGVSFEKTPAPEKTGSSGYYNDKALIEMAKKKGQYHKSFNGDAFSPETKKIIVDEIKNSLKKIDMLIYSVASPKRTIGENTYHSYLKTIGNAFEVKSLDFATQTIKDVTVESANQEEIDSTIKVMGGEDWLLWVETLSKNGLLADGFKTISYSYIGPEFIAPIYREGTIGAAKKHLEKTIKDIDTLTKSVGGKSHVAVCKALVTQASVAIPGIGLYTSVLYKVMKKHNIHENCIQQINRLFHENLSQASIPDIIRIDDWEMKEDIQKEVMKTFNEINQNNYQSLTDLKGVIKDFMNIFGFDIDEVDYSKDQDIS